MYIFPADLSCMKILTVLQTIQPLHENEILFTDKSY